jgi:4-hydroxybenzoate polyprenyltransferase
MIQRPSDSPLRAWFDLARAGNFPSVASNVLAALVLSGPAGMAWPAGGRLTLAIVTGCLIYAGGATFNDVADAEFDRRHRPERAIPRNVISRAGAAWVAAIEMLLGLGLLLVAGASALWALALAGAILVYDWIHKRWIGSVALMAGCRILLAFTLASLPGQVPGPAFIWWVGALFAYIVSLSLIARWEYQPGAPAARLGRAVGPLLAFIPLIDAIALLLVGAWLPAMACAAAVPLGRWAQRLAAST